MRQLRKLTVPEGRSRFRQVQFELLERRDLLAQAGTPDYRFGYEGRISTDLGVPELVAYPEQTPPGPHDGKIVAYGNGVRRFEADGRLDATFGPQRDGVAEEIGFYVAGAAIQEDGKIVVAGTLSSDFAVRRLLQGGTIDRSFGDNGQTITNIRLGDEVHGLAFDSATGAIVVVGSTTDFRSSGTGRDFAIVRYDSGGRQLGSPTVLDLAKGNPTARDDVAYSVAVFPRGSANSGTFIVAGESRNRSRVCHSVFTAVCSHVDHKRFALAKFNRDGQLSGKQFVDFQVVPSNSCTVDTYRQEAAARAIAVTAQNRIVVAGDAVRSCRDRATDIALAEIDVSSLTILKREPAINVIRTSEADRAAALAIQPDGKILVGGDRSGLEIRRYHSGSLQLDTSFGSSGILRLDASDGREEFSGLALDHRGRILAGSNGQFIRRFHNDLADRLDRSASNNDRTHATDLDDLSSIIGTRTFDELSIHISGDEDWYQFRTTRSGTFNDFVSLRFEHALGNLSLQVYDASGELWQTSATTRNSETISLDGLAANAVYYVRVFPAGSGPFDSTNQHYELVLAAPITITRDRYETELTSNDTPASAVALPHSDRDTKLADLSIHSETDVDWYRFDLEATGNKTHFVGIDFDAAAGAAKLALFDQGRDQAGVFIAQSSASRDGQTISLDGLMAGTYYLAVWGVNGSTLSRYDLLLRRPGNPIAVDLFEPNNGPYPLLRPTNLHWIRSGTLLAAPQFGLSIHNPSDEDWFYFGLEQAGEPGHTVMVQFDHEQGDLDLELYDAQSTSVPIRSSKSVNGSEQVTLSGLPAAWYYARVFGHHGATNPEYSISIVAPGDDPAETFSDRLDNDAAPRAYDLGTVRGSYVDDKLFSIDHPGDVDWFRFSLAKDATANDFARIDFEQTWGDIDLWLFREAEPNRDLRRSTTSANFEQVALDGLEAGSYLLRVAGHGGEISPYYQLTIEGPNAAEPTISNGSLDWAETPAGRTNNDVRERAYPLGLVKGVLHKDDANRPLSIQPSGDQDWFSFHIERAGSANHFVAISFDPTDGDLDLALYDSNGQLLGADDGIGNIHAVSLDGRQAGTYYVQIVGFQQQVSPRYSLTLSAPGTLVPDIFDRRWPNGGLTLPPVTATRLGLVTGRKVISGLSIDSANDIDWFQFEMNSSGGPTDSVSIEFDQSLGDLDLEIYDIHGNLLESSVGIGDVESIGLDRARHDAWGRGPFFLKVFGHADGRDTAINPSYSLILETPRAADRLEGHDCNLPCQNNNDSAISATDLRVVQGTLVERELSIQPARDEDWFRFQFASVPIVGDRLVVRFEHTLGDLDVELYDAAPSAAPIRSAKTAGNVEEISLEGLPMTVGNSSEPVIYYVRVFGHLQAANPTYELLVQAPSAISQLKADWAEPNSSQTPRDLHLIAGTESWDGLSIDKAGELDWYKFAIDSQGLDGNQVRVDFERGQFGEHDLELEVLRTNTAGECTEFVARSANNASSEIISLAGFAPGTYCVKVFGNGAATNRKYALTIDVPPRFEPDWAERRAGRENNNQLASAYDLRTLDELVVLPDLSIHAEGDVDWFTFELPNAGTTRQYARVDYRDAISDLDLELYDGRTDQRVAQSREFLDGEEISFSSLPAGRYDLRVIGADGATRISAYTLTINASPLLQPDKFEVHAGRRDNDRPRDAFDLRQLGDFLDAALVLRPYDFLNSPLPNPNETWYGGLGTSPGIGTPGLEADAIIGANSELFVPNLFVSPIARINAAKHQGGVFAGIAQADQEIPGRNSDELLPLLQTVIAIATPNVGIGGFSAPNSNLVTAGVRRFPSNINSVAPRPLPYYGPIELLGKGLGIHANRRIEDSFGTFNPFDLFQGRGAPQQSTATTALEFGTSLISNGFPSFLGGFGGSLAYNTPPPQIGLGGCLLLGLNCLSAAEEQPSFVFANQSIHSTLDQDWFRFELTETGTRNEFIGTRFEQGTGALELSLYSEQNLALVQYDPNKTNPLDVVTSSGDSQRIELNGLPAGIYLVRVRGVDTNPDPALENRTTNPDYALLVKLRRKPLPDRAEPNDDGPRAATSGVTLAGQALDLREVEGSRVLSGLSIHSRSDVDWFVFSTARDGRPGDFVRIDFDHEQGDLDLDLRNAAGLPVLVSGQPLGPSQGVGDSEEVSLAHIPRGTYFAKVSGYCGSSETVRNRAQCATNAEYSLSLLTPESNFAPDIWEPNNSREKPADLRSLSSASRIEGLTIHSGTQDDDYFRFRTEGPGNLNNFVRIEFDQELGTLQLELYGGSDLADSSCGTLIQRSMASGQDFQQVSLAGRRQGTYCLRITGQSASVANRYSLHFEVPTPPLALGGPSLDDWTIMIYMTATDLGRYAETDINEMEQAVSRLPASVNVAVLLDQSADPKQQFSTNGNQLLWGDTRQAFVQPDTDRDQIATTFHAIVPDPNHTGGGLDQPTGSPGALTNFIQWAQANAPARRYALILWNHGSGLDGLNFDDDTGRPDPLTTPELVEALVGGGVHFELIGFEACLMAMVEVEYALSPFADVLVASQEVVSGDGYDHVRAFSVLEARPDLVSAEQFAAAIVRGFERSHQHEVLGADTYSAVSVTNSSLPTAPTSSRAAPDNRLESLRLRLVDLVDELLKLNTTSTEWLDIRKAYAASTSFLGHSSYRDLGQFLDHLAEVFAPQSGLENADRVRIHDRAIVARNVLDSTVIARTADRRRSSGLSIYFPSPGDVLNEEHVHQYRDFYAGTSAQKGWGDFIRRFVGADDSVVTPTTDWSEANNDAERAFRFQRLNTGDHVFGGLSISTPTDEDWFHFFAPAGSVAANGVTVQSAATQALILDVEKLCRTSGSATPAARVPITSNCPPESSSAPREPGEYFARVRGINSQLVSDYSLRIRVSSPSESSIESIRLNDASEKSHDLGVIHGEEVFAGLILETATDDWFQFSTPRNFRDVAADGTHDSRIIRVLSTRGSAPVTAELYTLTEDDAEKPRFTLVSTESGTEHVTVTYDSGSGRTYRLLLRSDDPQMLPYSIHFTNSDLIQPANHPPEMDVIPAQTILEQLPLRLFVRARDVEGDTLTYRLAADAPTGASIDPRSGELTWTPSEAQGPETYSIAVSAIDGRWPNPVQVQTFTVTVREVNTAPSLPVIGNQSASWGIPVVVDLSAFDPDLPKNTLTYQLEGSELYGAAIQGNRLHWIPPLSLDPGNYGFAVRVEDDGSPTKSDQRSITINLHNSATVTYSNEQAIEVPPASTVRSSLTIPIDMEILDLNLQLHLLHGQVSQVAATLIAPTGTRVPLLQGGGRMGRDFRDTTLDDDSTISIASGTAPFSGAYRPLFSARETANGSSLTSLDGTNARGEWILEIENRSLPTSELSGRLVGWSLVVEPKRKANQPPTLESIAVQSIGEGQLLTFAAVANDVDEPASTLRFSLDRGAPAGATIDQRTGVFRWTPSEEQGPGSYSITVRVSDSGSPALSDTATISVTVLELNSSPHVTSIPDWRIDEGQLLAFRATATDADLPRQNLMFSLESGAPDGATIDPRSGEFSWRPSESQGGRRYEVRIRATDSGSPPSSGVTAFQIDAGETNSRPLLPALPLTSVTPGSLLQFVVKGADQDLPANRLSYHIEPGAPAGVAIHPTTGEFSWTPPMSHPTGVYPVTIGVVDDGSPPLTDTVSFSITVNPAGSGSIHGIKFNDLNRNRMFDEDEPRLAGWTVFLDENEDGLLNPGELRTVTDSRGEYSFEELMPGDYIVAEVPQNGWLQTAPGVTDFRVLSITGFSGANPYSLVELTRSPITEAIVNGNGGSVWGMDFDPQGILYGANSLLFTIDPKFGGRRLIGALRSTTESVIFMGGIAFSPTGQLFGVSLNGQELYSIDPHTAFATHIGRLSESAQGIDFGPDGTLYGVGFRLLTIDPSTASILSSRYLVPHNTNDIDFAPDGYIYTTVQGSSTSRRLFRIDSRSAEKVEAGEFASELQALASQITYRDEAATWRITLRPNQQAANVHFGSRSALGNRIPIAYSDRYLTPMNTPLHVAAARGILANDSDLDGDQLTVSLVDRPLQGQVTLALDGRFHYVPTTGFVGNDSFSYSVSDGVTVNGPIQVNISVGSQRYVVNSALDPGDGICDATECTLREAIMAANSTLPVDQIVFNLSPGTHTIQPQFPFPNIISPVILDATTIPGFYGVPQIEIDGSQAGAANGLTITSGESTIRGLVINRFSQNGIYLLDKGGNVITGNYIGTSLSGTEARGNGHNGIFIASNSSSNVVGTNGDGLQDQSEANVISGNDWNAVSIVGIGADRNVIAGNLIGTDITGSLAIGNKNNGIWIGGGARENRLGTNGDGSSDVQELNLISGNAWNGVVLNQSGTDANVIAGNRIGSDLTGTRPIANAMHGVLIADGAGHNRIGTNGDGVRDESERNLISGNGHSGVAIGGNGTDENSVAGNFIGTDAEGTGRLSNSQSGISISAGAQRNWIGVRPDSTNPVQERNLLSGNGWSGVVVAGVGTDNNVITGNYIGVDLDGELSLENGQDGVSLHGGAQRNRVGTDGDGVGDAIERNLISGNGWSGVGISNTGTSFNVVAGNYLGTDALGRRPLGNRQHGIVIFAGASGNRIGTDGNGAQDAAEQNVISGNLENGIRIQDPGTDENVVAGNHIGVDVTGTNALSNQFYGVIVFQGAQRNRIGTNGDRQSDSQERNVISANMWSGLAILGDQTNSNVVAGNFIGTDAAGQYPLGNAHYGLTIFGGAQFNRVGSSGSGRETSDTGNIVSANGWSGISLIGPGTTFNMVAGNRVGGNTTSLDRLGNADRGVIIFSGAQFNQIGGTAEHANVIVFNRSSGIEVLDAASTGNRIQVNVVHSNGGTEIDLGGNSNNANDHLDADAGPNGSQNAAVLDRVRFETGQGQNSLIRTLTTSSSVARVTGSLVSSADSDFQVNFYASRTADPSGAGQAERFIDTKSIRTDSRGIATFEFELSAVSTNELITATVMDSDGNTSELSLALGYSNQIPVTQPDRVVTQEDSSVTFEPLGNDVDLDGKLRATTLAIVSGPQHGTVVIDQQSGRVTYQPFADFAGTDEFTYFVGDDEGGMSNDTGVTLVVAPHADNPTSYADSYAGIMNNSIRIPVSRGVLSNDADADGDRLSAELVAPPSFGTILFVDEGAFEYTPAPGFIGDDQFAYVARDHLLVSNVSLVTLHIRRRGTAVYSNDTRQPLEDGGKIRSSIQIEDSYTVTDLNVQLDVKHTFDSDLNMQLIAPNGQRVELLSDLGGSGDDFRDTLLDDEAHDTLNGGAAPFSGRFRPEGRLSDLVGVNVQGSWILEIGDDSNGDTGLLLGWSLHVGGEIPANVPPVVRVPETHVVQEGSLLEFSIAANDPDGPAGSLSFHLAPGAPPDAAINRATGVFRWTPGEVDGPASFRFAVDVSDSGSPPLITREYVTVVVAETNSVPNANALPSLFVNEESLLTFVVVAYDSDLPANQLTFRLVDPPPGATIHPTSGEFAWIPRESAGPGTFDIQVEVRDDGPNSLTTTTTVRITVREANQRPSSMTLSNSSVLARVSGITLGMLSADDPDGDAGLVFTVLDPRFEIDGQALKLRDGQAFADDQSGLASVEVYLRDSGDPPLSVSQVISFEIHPNPLPWQYGESPLDTNTDGTVAPIDSLVVINLLNAPTLAGLGIDGRLPKNRPAQLALPYYDVNGDEFVSSIDVLLIFNLLNTPVADGERLRDVTQSLEVIPFVNHDVLLAIGIEWQVERLSNRQVTNPIVPAELDTSSTTVPSVQTAARSVKYTQSRARPKDDALDSLLEVIAEDVLLHRADN